MAEPDGRRVHIEIVDIMGGGECPSGLEVGQVWDVADATVPQGMCGWAWNAMLPFIATLRFDGRFPWRDEPWARLCCPDADNAVVFRVEVIED